MRARTRGLVLVVAVGFLCSGQAWGQKCPRGPANVSELTAQMESTNDPNVILRAAAIGGLTLLPELRKLSIPEISPETLGGAAQVSLARLGDEATYAELDTELNGLGLHYLSSVWAINKLLLVNTPRSTSMILAFLDGHPGPIILGCETDACYDFVPIIFQSLADVVENAPIKSNGKYRGSLADWLAWSKHEKPIPFSISSDLQDPYEQCLGRKVEWGFHTALVDLAASGDQRAVPRIQKLGSMGYPYNGYIGTRAPSNLIWLRHDYVETSLARLGDRKEFDLIVAHMKTQSFQREIQKLQIVGGKDAVEALVNSSNYFNTPWGRPFLKALSEMVQNPPLPPDADPSVQNIYKWKDWWAKNKDTAKFVTVPSFE